MVKQPSTDSKGNLKPPPMKKAVSEVLPPSRIIKKEKESPQAQKEKKEPSQDDKTPTESPPKQT